MAFDLENSGHHPAYIRVLARYWVEHGPDCELVFVVSSTFSKKFPDIVDLAEHCDRLRFVPAQDSELPVTGNATGALGRIRLLGRGISQWNVMARYARQLEVDHCLVMYIDGMLYSPLALRMPFPCPVSGIYFRPTFHYPAFGVYRPSYSERIRAVRQREQVRSAVRHSALSHLFCLDPFVVDHIHQLGASANVLHLADPVSTARVDPDRVAALRAQEGISDDGKLVLLFGLMTPRKGMYELLEAMQFVQKPMSSNTSLRLVGRVPDEHREPLMRAVATAQSRSCVDISVIDEFVPDNDVQAWFAAADVVAAPYQKHVGMSGITVQAAAVGRPLLCSDYGLMGELTRQRRLGCTVDASSPIEIGDALNRMLEGHESLLGDPAGMRHFAEQNSDRIFAQTLAEHVVQSNHFSQAT